MHGTSTEDYNRHGSDKIILVCAPIAWEIRIRVIECDMEDMFSFFIRSA